MPVMFQSDIHFVDGYSNENVFVSQTFFLYTYFVYVYAIFDYKRKKLDR